MGHHLKKLNSRALRRRRRVRDKVRQWLANYGLALIVVIVLLTVVWFAGDS